MAIPNYTPTGRILFGSVPWDNGYTHVRLYNGTSAQYEDIVSRMTVTSDDYTYIGRNRRIKVSIPADRLYHCNYCMYRNESLGTRWVYCFVTDVKYISDNCSEIQLETDVFQTYLYGVDWNVPACFIERETAPSNQTKYLFTNEPDFSLIYTVTAQTDRWFNAGGFVVMTCAQPKENSSIVDAVLNPGGWYADPAPVRAFKGIPNGCSFYYCPIDTTSGGSEALESFLNRLTWAGSIESVVAIFTVPDFAGTQLSYGFQDDSSRQDTPYEYTTYLTMPARGDDVDGYTPRNQKLLYYPYNFCRVTDFNGSQSDLRYELMGGYGLGIKYAVSPACQAIVLPTQYRGIADFDSGMVVACGAQGSWANNTFSTWLAQNAGMIALTVGGIALAGVSGGTSLALESRLLSEANTLRSAGYTAFAGLAESDAAAAAAKGMKTLAAAGAAAGVGYQQMTSQSHQPTVTRGQTNYNVTFETGVQGVHAQRVCVKAPVAEQIDQFFDRWGYAVERIEQVNIRSRPTWNYVKTGGCAPTSYNVGAGSAAPFGGNGTPAAALDVIRRAFDGGVTFWHTTSGFGDYSQDNSLRS